MHICSYVHDCESKFMRDLTRLLKALSEESRLRVLSLLIERECCVCEVMQVMGVSQSKASRTLTALFDAGILKQRKQGRWVLYSIDHEGMKAPMKDIVLAVSRAMAGNLLVAVDRERLTTAQRVGPGCASKACDSREVAEAPEPG